MSKMKDLYFDMFEVAFELFQRGLDQPDVVSALNSKFKGYDSSWIDAAVDDAANELSTYHNDMMHSVYSYEEQYERI